MASPIIWKILTSWNEKKNGRFSGTLHLFRPPSVLHCSCQVFRFDTNARLTAIDLATGEIIPFAKLD